MFMFDYLSQPGRLARPFYFLQQLFVCYLCRKVCSAEERDVILQCSSSRGAGKFVRSQSDSSQQRSSSRSAGSCLRLLLRFNAFIVLLAKHFELSFIFEKVYFAKPLLDERVLAQDVDCSLAAVVLRQREWKRAGTSTSAIEYPHQQ